MTAHAPAQGDKKLVQLLELLAECARSAGGDRLIERFLRGIEVA
jgi:hypothetical protein